MREINKRITMKKMQKQRDLKTTPKQMEDTFNYIQTLPLKHRLRLLWIIFRGARQKKLEG